MGKNLTVQKRGKGSTSYASPSFKFRGSAGFPQAYPENRIGKIIDIIDCRGHTAPLLKVEFPGREEILMQAPDGIKVADEIVMGAEAPCVRGNILPLGRIPEGTQIFNIEGAPGDGGKFVRAGGALARITAKFPNKITIMLPSKKERDFDPACRAMVGEVAGAGRTEKPFLKAGYHHFAMKARNKYYPIVSGTSKNSVSHPFGGRSTNAKGHATTVSRDAPPGRKVGKIAASRTGMKR
ncbi:50S ribosomal protein L2 [Candidatus Woesearchaeota archaeon]|nr:50S ribosomal protein L2 [Candidatus Woesearchaeota archaeon]